MMPDLLGVTDVLASQRGKRPAHGTARHAMTSFGSHPV